MFLEMKTNRDPSDSGENEVQLCKVSKFGSVLVWDFISGIHECL